MMTPRKRSHEETVTPDVPEPPPVIRRLRSMWQFSNLCQWIYIFGKAVKIDEKVDIDYLETECLKPDSLALKEVGLTLLKFLSSHRGLTYDLFDEYTRRQYVSKAPGRNPFGNDETPANFNDFSVFEKIRVLHELTMFAMMYSEKLREKLAEDKDLDQTQWRIEPYGWDKDERTYYVLDDNRVYRLTEAPPPPPPEVKLSKKTKAGRAALRAGGKRRRATNGSVEADNGDGSQKAGEETSDDGGLGGMKWECVAVTLGELHGLLATLQDIRDENERVLRHQLEKHLLPLLEKQEESRKRKEQQRDRDLLNLAKLANAKRSTRIAGRREQQIAEDLARQDEEKHRQEQVASRKALERQRKLEHERDKRLMSREKRLKGRQSRRLQHEADLAQLSESSRRSTGSGRISERRIQAELERNKQPLDGLDQSNEDWMFDCVCGVHGQIDDGTHSIACEKCNIWQHSVCVGVSEAQADKPEFQFVCGTCLRAAGEVVATAEKPRPVIKLKLKQSESPPAAALAVVPTLESADGGLEKALDDGPDGNLNDGTGSRSGPPVVIQLTAASAASPVVDAGPSPLGEGASRDAFSANATMLPPPVETTPRSTIPVKVSRPSHDGNQSFRGAAAHVPSSERSVLQTPRSIAASGHVFSSSPPPRLTPSGILSPTAAAAAASASSHSGNDSVAPDTPMVGGSSPFPQPALDMPTLPPPEHGISPTKHSPPVVTRPSTSDSAKRANQSPVIPPATMPLTPMAKPVTGVAR